VVFVVALVAIIVVIGIEVRCGRCDEHSCVQVERQLRFALTRSEVLKVMEPRFAIVSTPDDSIVFGCRSVCGGMCIYFPRKVLTVTVKFRKDRVVEITRGDDLVFFRRDEDR
jgi:hypothetical protein